MEMHLVYLNRVGGCNEDASKQSFCPENSYTCSVFGDPVVLPRVGDEYQSEIPPLVTKPDPIWLSETPNGVEVKEDRLYDFCIALPIPLMWIDEKVERIEHKPRVASDSSSVTEAQIVSEGQEVKAEATCMEIRKDSKDKGKGDRLVPGSSGESMCDIEEAGFLLGLYIFGKNLAQVKKFVERKQMGDILSFYYGKFYKSDKYRRWSECRKMKSRRCYYGQRLFSGWRHQELLSRLLPHLSEETQNTLLEVSRTFGAGKMLLEEYVFSLKAIAGLNALIQVIGIGKGKQDLTSNQHIPIRPEIPVGKACSNLSPTDIVNFLTGDFRLSKARSSDLFWAAVWPRLLARGWHSEQPNNNNSHGFAVGLNQHSLVFLLPGINKFSRRSLIKGKHYFDSVSDVLNEVASDPTLLKLDHIIDEIKPDQEEDFPNPQRHCYLQPRTPSKKTDIMKFTVVDSSLADGKSKSFKVRELRSLPIEIMNQSISTSLSGDNQEPSEESTAMSDPNERYDKDETNFRFDNDNRDTVRTSQCLGESRRHSTRNRPVTTRVLEALALGLLDVKQKRKSKDVVAEEDKSVRPSRRIRPKVRHTDKFVNSIADSKIEMTENNADLLPLKNDQKFEC